MLKIQSITSKQNTLELIHHSWERSSRKRTVGKKKKKRALMISLQFYHESSDWETTKWCSIQAGIVSIHEPGWGRVSEISSTMLEFRFKWFSSPSSSKPVPTRLELTRILFHHPNLSSAKSSNRLLFFKSILATSIHVLFGLLLLLGGPLTCIEKTFLNGFM